MTDQAPQKKEEGGGAPAWVMTFADLMSLLMCFFVLLLSFAEMDLQKFKQIAGSMKMAFGVQRDIKVKQPPKGTSVIAREFSPGRPTPTPMIEIRQNTIDENKQTLEFTDAITDRKNADSTQDGEQNDGSETAPVQKHSEDHPSSEDLLESGQDGQLKELADMAREMQDEVRQLGEKIEIKLPGENTGLDQIAKLAAGIEDQAAELMQADKDADKGESPDKDKDKDKDKHPDVAQEPDNEETQADARKLLQALAPEIRKGMVSVETQGNRIVLRIKEKGSFPSGSSELKGDFMPVISKLRDSLETIEGKVVVAGHTDNVPIKTRRFRSNWELSSSRAVTVVHELLQNSGLELKRFAVEGHGEAHPIVPNDTPENRALNRRVELTIIQGEADDSISEMSSSDTDPAMDDGPAPESDPGEPGTEPLADSATATETGDPDFQPIPDIIGTVIEDPFAGVKDTGAEAPPAEQAAEATDDVTIDVGHLREKLKSISDRLKGKTDEAEIKNE